MVKLSSHPSFLEFGRPRKQVEMCLEWKKHGEINSVAIEIVLFSNLNFYNKITISKIMFGMFDKLLLFLDYVLDIEHEPYHLAGIATLVVLEQGWQYQQGDRVRVLCPKHNREKEVIYQTYQT